MHCISHNYVMVLWSGEAPTIIFFTKQKWFKIQRFAHCSALFKISQPLLCKYMILLYTLKNRTSFNLYVLNRNTRNAVLPLLSIPNILNSNYRNHIIYQAPKIYNEFLKSEILFSTGISEDLSLQTLKKLIKSRLLASMENLLYD